jgi:hypothetical protein
MFPLLPILMREDKRKSEREKREMEEKERCRPERHSIRTTRHTPGHSQMQTSLPGKSELIKRGGEEEKTLVRTEGSLPASNNFQMREPSLLMMAHMREVTEP